MSIPSNQRQQRLLAALRRIQREGDLGAAGKGFGLLVDETAEFVSKVGNKGRHADRASRNPEHRLGFRSPANHVHVNIRFDEICIRMLGQIHDAAFDLGRPQEANRACRSRQNAICHQCIQRPCGFEYRDTARRVVVSSRPRVIEVAGKMDVLVRPIRATNGRRRERIVAGLMTGVDFGMQVDLFTSRQTLLKFSGLSQRNHEAE